MKSSWSFPLYLLDFLCHKLSGLVNRLGVVEGPYSRSGIPRQDAAGRHFACPLQHPSLSISKMLIHTALKKVLPPPTPPHTHYFREVRNISAGSCYSIHLRLQFRYQMLWKVWKKLLLLRMFLRRNNRQEPVRWFKEHEIP